MSDEGAIEVKKDLQLKQLGYVSLSLVYLDYMTFHDVFGGRSSYGAREERENGQGRFEHCDLLLRLLNMQKIQK